MEHMGEKISQGQYFTSRDLQAMLTGIEQNQKGKEAGGSFFLGEIRQDNLDEIMLNVYSLHDFSVFNTQIRE